MKYETRVPVGALASSVDEYWWSSSSAKDFSVMRQVLLPDPGVTLVFNLAAPHLVVDRDGRRSMLKAAWVMGERTRAVTVESYGGSEVVCMRFKPGKARQFFDLPIEELTDQAVDLEILWPKSAERIRERLANCTSMSDTANTLTEALEELRTNAVLHRSLPAAVDVLRNTTPHEIRIAEIARNLGVSERSLLRRFREWVGFGPKTLQRLFRFQRVLETVGRNPAASWVSVAQSCGFYDQSHFVHEFQSFSGVTPRVYRQRRGCVPYMMVESSPAPDDSRSLRAPCLELLGEQAPAAAL